jgi:hypothetical protein
MTPRTPSLSWRAFTIAWICLALGMALWSIATPIGAAPDEPAHLIKAASVSRGELVGAPAKEGRRVTVPEYIAFTPAQTCYAFNSAASAACSPTDSKKPDRSVSSSTTAGLYNPLYYTLVGWPSLLAHDDSGVYWMRVVSGIIVSFFLALVVAMVATWRKGVLPLVGILAATTPMVVFLGGTVNPNSLEITATLAAFVAMLAVVRRVGEQRITPVLVVLGVSAAVAANMRGLSVLWLAVVLLTPLLLLTRVRLIELLKQRQVQITIASIIVAVAAALIWVLATNSLGAGLSATPSAADAAPGVGTSPVLGFIWTALFTFNYGEQLVGVFGWLDTPAPPFVMFVWAALAGVLTVLALVLTKGKALLVGIILSAAVLLAPPLLQAVYIYRGGVIWQGRYTLPLFVCAALWLATALAERVSLSRGAANRLLVIVTVLTGAAQLLAFATALRRYTVGLTAGWQTLLHPLWSPPAGVAFALIGFLFVVSVSSVAVVRLGRRTHPLLLTATSAGSNGLEPR